MIAAALHCLVLTHELDKVRKHWTPRHDFAAPSTTHVTMAKVEKDSKSGHCPSVDIYKISKQFRAGEPRPNNSHSLGSMFRIIFQKAQSILYRGRPENDPYLFYITFILMLVYHNLRNVICWTDALDPAKGAFSKSLFELCNLFNLSTNNQYPINSRFDLDTYAASVDQNMLATEHYNLSHQLWIDNST